MGYDPDRFDHVDKFWICHLCHQILKDPVLVCVSDHVLCRDCISFATICPWPDCEERVFDDGFRSDVNMARFIATLVISCEECEWRGPIMEDADHAMQCEGRKVQCPNTNCTETINAGTLAVHLENCAETVVPCANSPACTHTSRRANIFQHGVRCEFNPCRWHASGCAFRGSISAAAAHEVYCTSLHEELARLRAVNNSLTTELKNHRVPHTSDEAAPGSTKEEAKVINDGTGREENGSSAAKASRKNRLRSLSASATAVNPDPSSRSSDDPASTLEDQDQARIEKEKRREKRRARRALAASEETIVAEAVPVESIRTEEEKRVRKEEKAKRRAMRRANREVAEAKAQEEANGVDENKDELGNEGVSLSPSVTDNAAVPPQVKGKTHEAPRTNGRNPHVSAPQLTVKQSSCDAQTTAPIISKSVLRPDATLDSIKSGPLSSPVNLMENTDKVQFSAADPVLVDGGDAESIVRGGGSFSPRRTDLVKTRLDHALPEHLPGEKKNPIYLIAAQPSRSSEKSSKSATEADAEPAALTEMPSQTKKRDREEAELDCNGRSTSGPQPKKVRIRLPSPFLQPDTDEDGEGVVDEDENGGRVEDWDPNADLDDGDGEADSDAASDAFGELLVTPVPVQEGKLTEEGEVEESINIIPDILPTPASLLAKYQASKPIYMQAWHTASENTHHAEDMTRSFASTITFSQQYPEFSNTPLEHHEFEHPLAPAADSGESGACYTSMSLSPVMRNLRAC